MATWALHKNDPDDQIHEIIDQADTLRDISLQLITELEQYRNYSDRYVINWSYDFIEVYDRIDHAALVEYQIIYQDVVNMETIKQCIKQGRDKQW